MFLFCADKHAPLKTKRVLASKSSLINSNLKHEMHNRDVLQFQKTSQLGHWSDKEGESNLPIIMPSV